MEPAVAGEGAPANDLVCAAPREPNSPCTSDTYDAPLATARPAATNATEGPSDIIEDPPHTCLLYRVQARVATIPGSNVESAHSPKDRGSVSGSGFWLNS